MAKPALVGLALAGRTEDDFGQPILREEGELLFDAPTVHSGAWAVMTEASWKHHRRSPRFGVGRGQKYRCTKEGVFLKIEG